MNRLTLLVCILAASLGRTFGQGVEPLAPSAVTPKPVEEPTISYEPYDPHAKAAPPPKLKSPRSPEGDKPLNPDKPDLAIQAVIIVKTRAEVQEAGVPSASGLVLRDVPFLDKPDFKQMVKTQYLGQPLTENRIRDLEDAIILYCREHAKPLVDVILPEQNIENGILQLWLLEGKIGKVTVRNDGRKWFRDRFILDQVRLRPGDNLDSTRLNEDLNWLNNNPFRQVDATFRPGDKLGLTDVELQVQDRLPFRPYFGYEDSGIQNAGPNRLLTGFNWGNAFFLDHQLNYQYVTDYSLDLLQAHSASYIAPLPWRHILTLYGSYVEDKANFPDTGTTGQGRSWQTSARYSVPLPSVSGLKGYRHEASVGFDFKRANNNLLSGGSTVNESDTDIAQFTFGYSALMPDAFGRTTLGLEGYYSPGDLVGRNSDADFNKLRTGAQANYVYGRLNLERVTRIPYDFAWVLRLWGQLANERLLPSEELALGGYNTIRGYDESVALGDNGWIVNNELRTPPLVLGNLLELPGGQDQLQFLAFCDCGGERVIDEQPADGANPNKFLCSVGAGLRYSISHNFSLRFDYGFPLTQHSLNEHSSRAHVGVLLSL
jgi:hemolysin activation/secretion protein